MNVESRKKKYSESNISLKFNFFTNILTRNRREKNVDLLLLIDNYVMIVLAVSGP